MLIVFSGLPGAGKTTLARQLASQTRALYLRLDSIEQAIRDAGVLAREVGTSGYRAAYGVAASNLGLGHRVVVDCVNPVRESRQAWREVAADAKVPLVNIEVVCSDPLEHRRRVESRQADIPGLTPPSWDSVLAHEYEPWDAPVLTLDTASMSTVEALALITQWLQLAGHCPVASGLVVASGLAPRWGAQRPQ